MLCVATRSGARGARIPTELYTRRRALLQSPFAASIFGHVSMDYQSNSMTNPFCDPPRAYSSSRDLDHTSGLASSNHVRQTTGYNPESYITPRHFLPLGDGHTALDNEPSSLAYLRPEPAEYYPYLDEYFYNHDELHLVESGPSTCESTTLTINSILTARSRWISRHETRLVRCASRRRDRLPRRWPPRNVLGHQVLEKVWRGVQRACSRNWYRPRALLECTPDEYQHYDRRKSRYVPISLLLNSNCLVMERCFGR